jgi:hypothetical protein
MTPLTISPEAEQTLLIGVLFALFIARRAYTQYRGARLSPGRLIGFSILYPLLFAVVIGSESYPVVPYWSLAADAVAVVAGSLIAVDHVGRRAAIYRENGLWMYRLGPLVPVVYIVLFLGRLVLELAIGIDPSAPSIGSISATAVLVLVVVDALYGFSTGLSLGRNVGIYRAWQRQAAAASSPLRSEPS